MSGWVYIHFYRFDVNQWKLYFKIASRKTTTWQAASETMFPKTGLMWTKENWEIVGCLQLLLPLPWIMISFIRFVFLSAWQSHDPLWWILISFTGLTCPCALPYIFNQLSHLQKTIHETQVMDPSQSFQEENGYCGIFRWFPFLFFPVPVFSSITFLFQVSVLAVWRMDWGCGGRFSSNLRW